MKFCILMGSPRIDGNTAALLKPFSEELIRQGAEVNRIDLYRQDIKPCIACRKCQDIYGEFGCPINDDVQDLFKSVLETDILILATPIYSWYCTPPMKAALDRLVYGMNKYYGNSPKKECLWEDKKCAIISTCGYRIEKGTDLFEEGIIRYCKHSNLEYLGMLAARDLGYHKEFITDEKVEQAKVFANQLMNWEIE
jgi:multimeric flavodoxin WrbA